MRPTMSRVLPAENGIIARIGFAGQLCARASRGGAGIVSAAPARLRKRRRVVMDVLPKIVVRHRRGGEMYRTPRRQRRGGAAPFGPRVPSPARRRRHALVNELLQPA